MRQEKNLELSPLSFYLLTFLGTKSCPETFRQRTGVCYDIVVLRIRFDPNIVLECLTSTRHFFEQPIFIRLPFLFISSRDIDDGFSPNQFPEDSHLASLVENPQNSQRRNQSIRFLAIFLPRHFSLGFPLMRYEIRV